ncbi:hypothetical protein ECRN5871_3681 [Escherichia coli RN587/1]|nr:hypothetical protein ECRN5871_3681 [Escherichia coli RN587/1]
MNYFYPAKNIFFQHVKILFIFPQESGLQPGIFSVCETLLQK